MVSLSAIHYVYIFMTVLILIVLICKKEIVIPCIIGILAIGYLCTQDFISSFQFLTNSLIASNYELFGIMLVIALVTAMSKAMQAAGVDELLIRPVRKVIKKPWGAFWGIGICMLTVSWLIWPSPGVALIGALLLPVAGSVGLPAMWAAVSMNLFGHGISLSSDFFIQGAPAITAKAAGIDVADLIRASIPLWAVMSITTLTVSCFMMRRDLKKRAKEAAKQSSAVLPSMDSARKESKSKTLDTTSKTLDTVSKTLDTTSKDLKTAPGKILCSPNKVRAIALLVILSFGAVIGFMIKNRIMGSDATALIAGVVLVLTCIITFTNSGFLHGLEVMVDYLKDGFIFSIKIFAPVIVIAAFFFLGSGSFLQKLLGEGAPAILSDISLYLSQHVPITRGAVVIIEAIIGAITGLDGSGFSGLPLTGSIASTFAASSGFHTATLAALGQITTIWIGGGTVIPWAVVPVAAICNIKPARLARINLIPVLIGLVVTCIVAVFLI